MPDDEPELEGPKGFRSRFYAHRNGVNQGFGGAGWEVAQLTDEEFDTLDEFDEAVTYTATFRRSGFYQINARAEVDNVAVGNIIAMMVDDGAFAPYTGEGDIGRAGKIQYSLKGSIVTHFNAGDNIRLMINGGVAGLILRGAIDFTYLTVHRLS